ncbi:hypothetical protein F5Y14DRAFT_255501 [Nemania sp. NC0429]|nr:hypothetical protein F5Y14DRAFT_255501 [Nemania sp. NC0429]
MFLHSGASLHGHEFSKRTTKAVSNPSNRRNPLLRSALSPPIDRASKLPSEPLVSHDNDAAPKLEKSSDCLELVVGLMNTNPRNCEEPRNESLPPQPEDMSEDGTSIISDTDASKVSSSLRRKRQSGPQRGTTYVLAHPPPKLRTKQRIIHMRPNLVLQVQQVTTGLRPVPTIDVYPSFAGARAMMAPLLKGVPRIAGIKRELSGQDILLVKSENYVSQASESGSEDDDGGIMARDLLAVISPSKTEDKAEIVLAEGAVWVATTRSIGNSYYYEFTSVDPMGTTITARWVRKQTISSSLPGSLPGTPTSPKQNAAKSQFSDTKFTFSMIDPKCRRHPILATLTSSSLTIPENYTVVPQSANRLSSNSQSSSLNSPPSSDQNKIGRRTQPVKEWQKSFISISAIWVALRHGWAPEFRLEDFIPFRTLPSLPMEGCGSGRRRSLSASADLSISSNLEASPRRKHSIGMRQPTLRSTNDFPRRAMSTGTTFVHKRRAKQQENDDHPPDGEHDRLSKLRRRALSGDWNVGFSKHDRENSMTGFVMDSVCVSPSSDKGTRRVPTLAPSPIPAGRRVVSVHSPLGSPSPGVVECDILGSAGAAAEVAQNHPGPVGASETHSKSRHHRWKSMANWFRKVSGR